MKIITGDCREVMAEMEAASVDAIVTDPPYGLSDETPESFANRVLRVLPKIGIPDLDKLESGAGNVRLRRCP